MIPLQRKWENDLQLYAVLWILLVMLSKKKPGAKHYRLVIPFMRSSKKAKLREVRVSATTGREIRGTSEMLTICWLPGCVSLWKVHTIYLQYVPFNVYHHTLIKVWVFILFLYQRWFPTYLPRSPHISLAHSGWGSCRFITGKYKDMRWASR